MDYKKILDDILELDDKIIVIRGFADIILNDLNNPLNTRYKFKDFNKDSYWILLGKDTDEMIIETMSDLGFDSVEGEGECEFKAVLKWIPGDYDEYGRRTMRDYLEVQYIELLFIQTFTQRDRQEKLDSILIKEMYDLFKF